MLTNIHSARMYAAQALTPAHPAKEKDYMLRKCFPQHGSADKLLICITTMNHNLRIHSAFPIIGRILRKCCNIIQPTARLEWEPWRYVSSGDFISSPLIDGVTIRGEDCTSLARELGGVLDVLAGKRAEGG
jgi:hypothetical protein